MLFRNNIIIIILLLLYLSSSAYSYYEFITNIPTSVCDMINVTKKKKRYPFMLLDEKHHIIMDWSPKAACTKAVEMFWNEMGIYRGVYYPQNAFVHDFRPSFMKACGLVNEGMMRSSKYYKFKVVRNPYDRAVSSYLHLMKTNITNTIFDTKETEFERKPGHPLNNLSFESLLSLYVREVRPLLQKNDNIFNSAVFHLQPQCLKEEVFEYKRYNKSIFNRIVHVENFDEEIGIVNNETNMNYSYPTAKDNHVHLKFEDALDDYVGSRNYSDLMTHHMISENYGNFYNRKTKRLVENIFADDFLLYAYEYPFSKTYK